MTPYLTSSGRAIILAGIICLLMGVVMENVTVLLLGQVQLALVVFAFFFLVPSALVVDRRRVRIDLEVSGHGGGHLVGLDVDVKIHIQNEGQSHLRRFRLEPHTSEGLSIELSDDGFDLLAGHRVTLQGKIKARRAGRLAIHGFDVSTVDPMSIAVTRDYLPATLTLEFYPAAGRLRRRVAAQLSSKHLGGEHLIGQVGDSADLRELRDYRPSDSLRSVAWKPSIRLQRLIVREYDRETTLTTYLLLDMSSSMRGGEWPGQKLDYAIRLCVDMADEVMSGRDKVGLMTFDEKLYGYIAPGNSQSHYQRLLHHLIGLTSVVDPDLTDLREEDVENLLADYLLVQERLDFRRGEHGESSRQVHKDLLDRWLASVESREGALYHSPVLREGVLGEEPSSVRTFLARRGVEIPYRVEARLGMKERGLLEAVEHLVHKESHSVQVVVISDLCAMMNPDVLRRALRLLRQRGHKARFIVPFTPSFYSQEGGEKYEVLREIFAAAEGGERQEVIRKIRAAGFEVFVSRPGIP